MAIARVSVLEFDSQEALEHAQKSHKLMRAKVFPHLKMCLCVRTGPTSFIDISVYPSEEAAEANLEDRQKFHEEALGSALKDDFYYQGDIDYFFQSTSLSELGLKEYKSFLMLQPNRKGPCHGTCHGRSQRSGLGCHGLWRQRHKPI